MARRIFQYVPFLLLFFQSPILQSIFKRACNTYPTCRSLLTSAMAWLSKNASNLGFTHVKKK